MPFDVRTKSQNLLLLFSHVRTVQEYNKAYNAYSAALQLSPVGPSSHVFLSNRSAALLSLKRYSAAATDAKRAIALAPTFGKAHARLGQSLYFLKDYEGAVSAYEDAITYEPDNPVTATYLEKAKLKLKKQQEKATRLKRNDEVSVLTEDTSVQPTVAPSIASDPNASATLVQGMGMGMRMRSRGNAMAKATVEDGDDPDFDEALRIQERANKYLANKKYKFAIEEYTAALFLVPDDDNLSPDLHLGRAHALNGSRRHESAKMDAQLALKIKPSPEAYSTLAKSLFYIKDFVGAIEAFGDCQDMLPQGESLSMFDRAYLQKSQQALRKAREEGEWAEEVAGRSRNSKPIPKLKPPRFVPREEVSRTKPVQCRKSQGSPNLTVCFLQALNRAPNVRAMPKDWPQQSPRSSMPIKVGPEREIVFLSDALGVKLNRGSDGFVRVIDVSPDVPGSPIAREGDIEIGDIVRQAAGVDIRRPITNIMWGDTVALIKMAPRPITLIFAEELTRQFASPEMR